MAIFVNVVCKDKERRDSVMESFHEALKGSPAYKDTEIALVGMEDERGFTLCVGENSKDGGDISALVNFD